MARPDSVVAARSAEVAPEAVWLATAATSATVPAMSPLLAAVSAVARVISAVVAVCSSTAPAMASEKSFSCAITAKPPEPVTPARDSPWSPARAAVGTHTVTATATDNAGRTSTATRSYTVAPYTTNGYFAPIDMTMVNTAKAGSTIPLKFEIFRNGVELTDTARVAGLKYAAVDCNTLTTLAVDEIETLASGSTALRYDSTSGQFIYNWKTPAAGCYKVTTTSTTSRTRPSR